jgi:transposase
MGGFPPSTWGHNNDHRPDLKQVLYLLTVTGVGSVPIQFRVESGNTIDDKTHEATWDVLCILSGRRDFLYVFDSKLATLENMAYIHQRNERFVSVLPRTRQEDRTFRELLQRGEVQWSPLWARKDEAGEIEDQFAFATPVSTTSDGYRLV